MPLHLAALVPSSSSIVGFVARQLKSPVAKGLGLDVLSKAYRRGIEKFLLAMESEFERSETFNTLLQGSIKESVSSFINSEAVQELLSVPFKDPSSFDIARLAALWREIPLETGSGKLIDLPSGFDWDAVGASYLSTVFAIMEETPELRSIWLSNNVEQIRKSIQAIEGPPSKFDLEIYRRALIEDFGAIKLSAVRVDCDPNCCDEGVSLQNVFVPRKVKDAFPPRDVSRDYRRRASREVPGTSASDSTQDDPVELYQSAPVLPMLDILQEPTFSRVVILGDPGLGKSTLLEHIALNWAQRSSTRIPFLIELRKYTQDHARPKSFLEYLEAGTWSSCRLPQREVDQVLRQKEAVMLFDGLDEVFADDLRENVVAEIIRFCREYPSVKVIVTTRSVGYVLGSRNREHFGAAGFRHFTLLDFGSEEIVEFVRKWYSATIPNEHERATVTDRLIQAIVQSRSIRELAGNPLLLTMMVLLNQRKHLPRERLSLYQSCAELLVEGWDAARHLDRSEYLTHEDKIEILQQIAFEMQQETEGLAGNAISESRLKTILVAGLRDRAVGNPKIVAEKIVEALVERDFMLCSIGDGQFAFVHRTFLEYFCAREYIQHLKNAGEKEELRKLFLTRWADDAWHEVLRLVCAMAGPDLASELIRELLRPREVRHSWNAIFLASECVFEIRQAGKVDALKSEIKSRLIELLEFHAPTERYSVRDQADYDTVSVRLGALDRIMRFWPDDATRSLLQKATENQYWKVRYRAAEMLARHWNTEETRHWLQDLAINQESALVVQAAVRGLSAGWPDDETRKFLLSLLQTSRTNVPRSNVIQELSQTWPQETTWEWLVQEAISEPEDYAAGEAIRELGRRWQDERTKRWLLERVSVGENRYIQQVSARVLVSNWPGQEIEGSLLEITAQNKNGQARDAALIGLARIGSSRIKTLIVSTFENIEDSETRRQLIYDLVWHWPDHDTMQLLFKSAGEDKDAEVRRAAMHQLARQWRQEVTERAVLGKGKFPDTAQRISFIREFMRQWPDSRSRAVLMRVADSDGDANVRKEALFQLERTWPSKSIYEFLRKRSKEDSDMSVRSVARKLLGSPPDEEQGQAVPGK